MKNRSTDIKRSSLPPRLLKENENGVRIKIYVQGHMIGAGKMELFHLISQKGSIRAAALSMGMSTKRATLLLKTIQVPVPQDKSDASTYKAIEELEKVLPLI